MEHVADLIDVSWPSTRSFVVVHLFGELDVASTPELRRRLTMLISDGCVRLVLDADSLQFIDAAGIGALVYASNQARAAGGWIRLIGVKPAHRRLLMLLRLGRQLPMREDLQDALREA